MSGEVPIRLLLSDVDGTLVTPDKQLTEAAIAAARKLDEAGIALAVTSSRPPRGIIKIAGALALKTPIGGFNGGRIVWPDGQVIEERLIAPDATRQAVETILAGGADVWLFAGDDWMVRDPVGAYVDHEFRTVGFGPTVVADFAPFYDKAAKLVGVSADFEVLKAIEAQVKAVLGQRAAASRSQPYYLDVTHPEANKGTVLKALSRRLGIPQAEIAAIGDMENDVAMFVEAGLPIAMGNAPPPVQAKAQCVTASNTEDGWAQAVERFVLPRAPQRG